MSVRANIQVDKLSKCNTVSSESEENKLSLKVRKRTKLSNKQPYRFFLFFFLNIQYLWNTIYLTGSVDGQKSKKEKGCSRLVCFLIGPWINESATSDKALKKSFSKFLPVRIFAY